MFRAAQTAKLSDLGLQSPDRVNILENEVEPFAVYVSVLQNLWKRQCQILHGGSHCVAYSLENYDIGLVDLHWS